MSSCFQECGQQKINCRLGCWRARTKDAISEEPLSCFWPPRDVCSAIARCWDEDWMLRCDIFQIMICFRCFSIKTTALSCCPHLVIDRLIKNLSPEKQCSTKKLAGFGLQNAVYYIDLFWGTFGRQNDPCSVSGALGQMVTRLISLVWPDDWSKKIPIANYKAPKSK